MLRDEIKSGVLLALIVGMRAAAPAGDKKVRAIDWFTVKTRYDVSQSFNLKAAVSPTRFLNLQFAAWVPAEPLPRWPDANGQ